MLELLLGPVFTRNICGFSSIILLQTRQKYAGGLSPGKYFSRSMQQNLPKRHVYTLVKTGSYYLLRSVLQNQLLEQHQVHAVDRLVGGQVSKRRLLLCQ